jgi:hypothetical protein
LKPQPTVQTPDVQVRGKQIESGPQSAPQKSNDDLEMER